MITVHGIPNCDTVKKARAWLDQHGVAYRFHDFRKDGADPAMIAAWAAEVGWEKLLNRAGTTFRKLPEAERAVTDAAQAVRIMAANPSAIKRPVVTGAGPIILGFRPEAWAERF